MRDFYCVDIEFLNMDFRCSEDLFNSERIRHRAHFSLEPNPIQLKIFYEPNSCFVDKFLDWTYETNFEKFGEVVMITVDNQDDKLVKIDLSKSAMLNFTFNTSFIENGQRYILIDIDSAKIYRSAEDENWYSADFYLNNAGFKFVKDFYSTMIGWDGVFTINKKFGQNLFYNIGKAQFRPEFKFIYSDNINIKEICIEKQPKLCFKFSSDTSEEEINQYCNIICLLASFYYHDKIQPVRSCIYMTEYKITTHYYNIDKSINELFSLKPFGIKYNFNHFLIENWQDRVTANFDKLSVIINLFNQALQVDSNSEFLIRYNILEICSGKKNANKKFKEQLTKSIRAQKYKEAYCCLLQTICTDEHIEFKKKWESISKSLMYKPMKSALFNFFEELKIDPNDFPISLRELLELRNNITHGSISNVHHEKVKIANELLYRLNGIVILNTIGIKGWKLNN